MSYHIKAITSDLIYIYVESEPTLEDDKAYLENALLLLDAAEQPLYFLVDFTHHMTRHVGTIRQAASLSKHPNFGGTRAFGVSMQDEEYGHLFATFSRQNMPFHSFPDAQSALDSLEELNPGLSEGIDLASFLRS